MQFSFLNFWKAIVCYCWLPMWFDSSSNSENKQTTNNYDQRQVITNTTTVDGGAIQGAIGLAQQVATLSSKDKQSAYDYADNIFSSAIDFADKSGSRAMGAYDRAAAIQSDALHTLQGAYADAKGTSDAQNKIFIGVLIFAGVVTVAAVSHKG